MEGRGVTQQQIAKAIDEANRETGGSVLELAETEFMVRATGSPKTLKDFRAIPLRLDGGVRVTLGDVALIQLGPVRRRGGSDVLRVGKEFVNSSKPGWSPWN